MHPAHRLFWIASFLMITTWWSFAFMQQKKSTHTLSYRSAKKIYSTQQKNKSYFLSPMHRYEIAEALSGNIKTILDLVDAWDLDAKILKTEGVENIKTVDDSMLFRLKILSRLISYSDESLQTEKPLILPQTYMAATYLLSIAPSYKIAALPKMLRSQPLFSDEKMSAITQDIHRYNNEALYAMHPTVAIVAPYSDPTVVHTLNQQNIPTLTLETATTVEEIKHQLLTIGELANNTYEAEILSYFMQAALIAIENRFHLHKNQENKKVAVLKYYQSFFQYPDNSLTSHLIDRIDQKQFHFYKTDNYEVSKEALLNYNPDILLISSLKSNDLEKSLLNDLYIQQTNAYKEGRVHFLDEAIQDSPTHFTVLAYFDLINAVTSGALEI